MKSERKVTESRPASSWKIITDRASWHANQFVQVVRNITDHEPIFVGTQGHSYFVPDLHFAPFLELFLELYRHICHRYRQQDEGNRIPLTLLQFVKLLKRKIFLVSFNVKWPHLVASFNVFGDIKVPSLLGFRSSKQLAKKRKVSYGSFPTIRSVGTSTWTGCPNAELVKRS